MEDLYWRCRDAFLTSNETTLKAQLTEFRDHKLIKIKKVSFILNLFFTRLFSILNHFYCSDQ